jgi:hypothetical protein
MVKSGGESCGSRWIFVQEEIKRRKDKGVGEGIGKGVIYLCIVWGFAQDVHKACFIGGVGV